MSEASVPPSGIDVQVLDAYLRSERSPHDCMMLSDLDGFLTGIAIGPELVLPSEWLPIVWGGSGPNFASAAEGEQILGGILARYNEILAEVAAGTPNPIFWQDQDGTVIPTDWAKGFMMAVALRQDAWTRLLRSKEFRYLLPIMVLCGNEDEDPPFDLSVEEEHKIKDAAPDLFPESIVAIAAFWERRKKR